MCILENRSLLRWRKRGRGREARTQEKNGGLGATWAKKIAMFVTLICFYVARPASQKRTEFGREFSFKRKSGVRELTRFKIA